LGPPEGSWLSKNPAKNPANKFDRDIDFMLTKPGTSSSHDLHPFLIQLVDKLTREGFLVAALVKPGSVNGSGSKWHGAALLPGTTIWRRIDLLLVPETEWGAALIYFTGDDIFNRSIRLLSSRKGMRLNQRGLYKDVMRGPGRVKLNEGTLIEGADEKKIFAALGVPWRPPEQRICN
jgi:DNA polymerase IV